MRDALIGGLVGAGLALLVGFYVWEQPIRMRMEKLELSIPPPAPVRGKPRDATITLTSKGASEGRCVALIDNDHMGGFENEDVYWNIVDDETPSCANGAWAVWLEFVDADHPMKERRFRIGRSGRGLKLKSGAKHDKLHKYKILMVGDGGSNYEMMDPDLEVEPPSGVVPPVK